MSAFRSNGKEIAKSRHVLWLATFTVSRDNVRKYITDLTIQATAVTGDKCYSRVVLPTKITGEPLGFAFVWITSRACFDWIVDQESHPPLVMNPEEFKLAKNLIAGGYVFDEKLGIFSDEGIFNTKLQPSLANRFDEDDRESNDALCCRQPLPTWYSPSLLLKDASPYATRGKVSVYMTKGKNPKPILSFAEGSNDGLFAFQMMRIFRIVNPGDSRKFVDLVFDHAWKSIVRS
jgi:hypothetical protein